MKQIHLISGPRNISTALMYSFGNRSDTAIVDEPFYAHYLTTHPEIDHPGKEETLKSQESDANKVIENLYSFSGNEESYFFIKNMAHHLDGLDWGFLLKFQNFFLIRNPKNLISSFSKVIPNPTMLDIGLELEWEIFSFLKSNNKSPIVLDSDEVIQNPERVLSDLCEYLEIPFSTKMLKWEPGSRKEDGVWAKYWYDNVHKSSGFVSRELSDHTLPNHLNDLHERALVFYNKLKEYSI